MVHDDCTTCHESSGVLKAAYGYASAMPDGGAGTNNGGGDCSACHGEYFDSHANMDHSALVSVGATGCDSCHDATAGGAAGVMPTDDADAKVHDFCSTCHESTGVLKAAYGYASSMPDGGAGSNNGGGDCSACHGVYFDSHTHHGTASNDVSYNVATDTSQSTATGCAVCHDDNSGALASWADIYVEHLSSCANCHSYDGTSTAPLADVQTAISSGSAATCATCHTDKVPNVEHGNPHPANDFAWDGNCSSCHTGANVVADVHTGCTTCHASSAASRDNEKLGDASNGIDGDATQADGTAAGGTWSSVFCSTCHNVASTTTTVDAHHIATAGGSTCADCHDGTGSGIRLADHTAMVATYVNCSSCHTDTGMTVSLAVPRFNDT